MWGQRQGDFSNLPAPGFGYSCELQLLWIPHLNSVSWDGIVLKLTKKVAQWQTMLETMMQIRLWMKDRGWRLLWKVREHLFISRVGYDDFLIFSFHFFEAPPDNLRGFFLTPLKRCWFIKGKYHSPPSPPAHKYNMSNSPLAISKPGDKYIELY